MWTPVYVCVPSSLQDGNKNISIITFLHNMILCSVLNEINSFYKTVY